mmetsp:Transcript_5022/g.14314  ORF Transcript_5022/g.14314 Transcript_5022/m.14314 type:complete len:214 (+) Transcript_5022:27-668(+)
MEEVAEAQTPERSPGSSDEVCLLLLGSSALPRGFGQSDTLRVAGALVEADECESEDERSVTGDSVTAAGTLTASMPQGANREEGVARSPLCPPSGSPCANPADRQLCARPQGGSQCGAGGPIQERSTPGARCNPFRLELDSSTGVFRRGSGQASRRSSRARRARDATDPFGGAAGDCTDAGSRRKRQGKAKSSAGTGLGELQVFMSLWGMDER